MNNPKTDIPRDAGKQRQVRRLQPGWWVHLEPNDGASTAVTAGWEQIDFVIEAVGIYVLKFVGTDEDVTATSGDWAQTLTEREAAKLGLTAETVKERAA